MADIVLAIHVLLALGLIVFILGDVHISKNNSQKVANFNGTGTTYDGPTGTAIVQLAKNDTLRVNRQSGNAYNPSHTQHYFFAHLIG